MSLKDTCRRFANGEIGEMTVPSPQVMDRGGDYTSIADNSGERAVADAPAAAAPQANCWPWCLPVIVTGLGDACCNCMAADGGGCCCVTAGDACGCFILPTRCGNVCECSLCTYIDNGHNCWVKFCSVRHGDPLLRDGPSDCFAALRGHNFVRPHEEAAAGIYSGMAAVDAGAAVGRRNNTRCSGWVKLWTSDEVAVAHPNRSLCWQSLEMMNGMMVCPCSCRPAVNCCCCYFPARGHDGVTTTLLAS